MCYLFHSRRYEEKGKRMMRRGPGKIFRKRVRTIYNFDIVTMMVIVMMMMLMKMSYDDDNDNDGGCDEDDGDDDKKQWCL